MAINDLIFARMEALRLTQYQLAKQSGVGQGHLSKILKGEFTLPTKPTRTKLGDVLGLTEEDWFRAADVLPPVSVSERQSVPAVFDAAILDDTLPPDDEVIAAVEAIDDAQFQEQMAEFRDEVSSTTYLRLCRQIYRSQKEARGSVLNTFRMALAG